MMKLKLEMQINLHRTEFGIYCMVASGVNALYYSSNLYRPTIDFICVYGAFRSHLCENSK